MRRELKKAARDLKQDLPVYQMALKDPRTPKVAKVLLAIAVGYAMLPFDLIPDFVPVLGHLDDAVIIPVLIRIALRLIPEEVMDECRLSVDAADGAQRHRRHKTHRVARVVKLRALSAKAKSDRLGRRGRRR